jgi:hypothetical protein
MVFNNILGRVRTMAKESYEQTFKKKRVRKKAAAKKGRKTK